MIGSEVHFLPDSGDPKTRSPITEVPFALFLLSTSLRRWRDVSQLARRFEIVSARSGTKFTLLSNSGGPDKRNTMNNETKFYHFRSGVCWLITMCKDHGALRPSA